MFAPYDLPIAMKLSASRSQSARKDTAKSFERKKGTGAAAPGGDRSESAQRPPLALRPSRSARSAFARCLASTAEEAACTYVQTRSKRSATPSPSSVEILYPRAIESRHQTNAHREMFS